MKCRIFLEIDQDLVRERVRRIAKGVTKKVTKKVTKGTERGIARRRAGGVRGPAKDGGNLRGRRKS